MFSTISVLTAMLAVAPMTTNAHMFMRKPVPYGSPDNGPLLPDGSNFPCRNVLYTGAAKNDWAVGSTQRIGMEGTAVHSGGSCQVSVTTDKAPSKSSKWKVIHSVHGGCPTPPKAGGNYDEALGGGKGPDNLGFDFQVPSELPNGDFSMAWTWFNKVGQREMYMYCAPVTVTGGANDQKAFEALPDMAVANIAGQGTCKTTESMDYEFENPGKYVTKGEGGKGPFVPLCGGTGGTGSAPAAPAAPQQSAPAPAPSPANSGTPKPSSQAASAGTPASPSAAPSDNKQTSTLRTVLTVTAPSGPAPSGAPTASQAPSSAPAASQAPVAPKPASSGAPAPPQTPASPSQSPAAPAPGGASGQTCSPNGSIVCSSDGKQFGMCNWGKAVMQPVAAGTSCKDGKIAKRRDYPMSFRTVYT